jgi:hypothetical protein
VYALKSPSIKLSIEKNAIHMENFLYTNHSILERKTRWSESGGILSPHVEEFGCFRYLAFSKIV